MLGKAEVSEWDGYYWVWVRFEPEEGKGLGTWWCGQRDPSYGAMGFPSYDEAKAAAIKAGFEVIDPEL